MKEENKYKSLTKKELIAELEKRDSEVVVKEEVVELPTYRGKTLHPSTASRFTRKLNEAYLKRKESENKK